MPSFQNTALFAAAILASVAKGDYYIDPDSVSQADRDYWCQSQISSCPLICNQVAEGDPLINTCDADTLQYGCLCADNTRPNISEYSLTVPYFTCTEYGNQCVAACNGNTQCQSSCRVDNPCGAQNPTRINVTETDTDSTEETESDSDDDDDDSVSTGRLDDDIEDAAMSLGRSFGLATVAGTLFAAFALL